jgi:hypothetical protein
MLKYNHKEPGSGAGQRGIFVQDCTIVAVKNLSGTVHPRIGEQFDLYLALIVDVGQSFQPTVELFGNLKRDENGKAISYGSAFKVGELFHSCGVELVIDENEDIPQDIVNALVGKKFAQLKYIAGVRKDNPDKVLWYSWDIVGSCDDHDSLIAYFVSQVKKNRIKKFNPNVAPSLSFFPTQIEPSNEDPF